MTFHHVSVLLKESVDFLDCRPGGIYVDCTLGGGGHTTEIVRRIMPDGLVIAIDQDSDAICAAKKKLSEHEQNIIFVQDNFAYLKKILSVKGFVAINGAIFDLGVSSFQFDEADRGFSYRADAPLDMRMDRSKPGTAAELLAKLDETALAAIIRDYGEEKWAARIARFIVEARSRAPVETTGQLVDLIKAAIPASARREGGHPAKRTFQALRIAVNDELENIKAGLESAIECLAPGGRLSVITFHSLEDRIVKNVFNHYAKSCICPQELPVCVCRGKPVVRILTKKPVTPTQNELETNPRSHSAKLRAIEKF